MCWLEYDRSICVLEFSEAFECHRDFEGEPFLVGVVSDASVAEFVVVPVVFVVFRVEVATALTAEVWWSV